MIAKTSSLWMKVAAMGLASLTRQKSCNIADADSNTDLSLDRQTDTQTDLGQLASCGSNFPRSCCYPPKDAATEVYLAEN